MEPANFQHLSWHISLRSWYYCQFDIFGTSVRTFVLDLKVGTSLNLLSRIKQVNIGHTFFVHNNMLIVKIYVHLCNLWVNKQLRRQNSLNFVMWIRGPTGSEFLSLPRVSDFFLVYIADFWQTFWVIWKNRSNWFNLRLNMSISALGRLKKHKILHLHPLHATK